MDEHERGRAVEERLATDQVNRAWFSNYGNWVDIFALGEGLINAYAHGEYTYHEEPKAPAKEIFSGLARWSGTSFSAPLVAGLIASQIPQSGSAAAAARPWCSECPRNFALHGSVATRFSRRFSGTLTPERRSLDQGAPRQRAS